MPHTYEYPRAALTVDIAVFALDDDGLKVMLIERGLEPFVGRWALPGGFVRVDETLEDAARRELEEETGLRGFYLEQLGAFGAVERDPRERVVTVAFTALVNLTGHNVKADTDAASAAWFSVDDPPALAFDHDTILAAALVRLREKVRQEPVGFELLPRKFPLRDLQRLYETVLGRGLDKRNFRKKILKMEVLVDLDEVEQDVAHRAARLYRFDPAHYLDLVKQGINGDIGPDNLGPGQNVRIRIVNNRARPATEQAVQRRPGPARAVRAKCMAD